MKKENEATKDRIVRDIINIFEQEKKIKPVKVDNFWRKHYVKYETNGDRNKTLSVEEYINKIKPCQKDIINDIINYSN